MNFWGTASWSKLTLLVYSVQVDLCKSAVAKLRMRGAMPPLPHVCITLCLVNFSHMNPNPQPESISLNCILILSYHLRLGLRSDFYRSSVPTKTCSSHLCYIPNPSHSPKLVLLSLIADALNVIFVPLGVTRSS